MDIVLRKSRGHNIVVRQQALPRFYAPAAAATQLVEVWWKYEGEANSSAKLIGTFRPEEEVSFPFTPEEDQNVILLTRSISADGVPSVISLDDAVAATVLVQRETAAPSVAQVGAATQTLVVLAIEGFSSYALRRKVRVADDSGMTTNVTEQITSAPVGQMPRLHDLVRSDGGTGTKTVYVRVSHSSSTSGSFGAESAAQAFTFADSGGTGGTSDDADPISRKTYTLY